MVFGRVLDIYAGDNPAGTQVGTATLMQQGELYQLAGINHVTGEDSLHASAEVHRSNTMDRNVAEVKIMNLNSDTRKWLEDPGKILRVDAGYTDEGFGTIFLGQIDYATSTLIESDWVTTINAYGFRARSMEFETLLTAVSYDPGTDLQTILNGLGLILGVPVFGVNVSNIIPQGGFVDVGPMRKMFRRVEKILAAPGVNLGLYYDLAELRVFKAGQPDFQIETLMWDLTSGLTSAKWVVHEVTAWRKEVKAARALQKAQAAYNKRKSPDGQTRAAQTVWYKKYADAEAKRERVELHGLVNHIARPNCPVKVSHPALSTDGYMLLVADDITYRLTNFGEDFDMAIHASRDASGNV
jgi:hypothetical protein